MSLGIGQSTELWKVHEALALLYLGQGRSELAERSCQAALQVLEDLRARAQNPVLRAALDASPYRSRLAELLKAIH